MAHRAEVLHDVFVERERQIIKFGGADHDDRHTMDEWRELITQRCERAPLTQADDRRLLIEVAALAVAAVEALDRRLTWSMPAAARNV